MMRKVYFVLVLFFIAGPALGQPAVDPEKETLSLYPNPAKSTLWIKTSNKKVDQEDIHIYNIIGNKLDLQTTKIEDGNFSIEVEDLPAGYYLLVVENEETKFTKTVKFLKK